MSNVTSFTEKKREKQLTYERKLLRNLSIDELKKSVTQHLKMIGTGSFIHEGVEEACMDVGIEAFLNGGEYSRFVLYGETMEMIKNRCGDDRAHLIETLYNFWLYWDYGQKLIQEEQVYSACEYFVDEWWQRGFQKGERRYKLRLH
ncbi:YbaK family protein [Lederbergia sp. NSJ-179]|nr:YbaK family protein [Lederbergia sp. NSJ-179]